VATSSASQNPRGWLGTRSRKRGNTLALVAAKRLTSTKASTAALGPFRQRLFSSCDALLATRLAARNGGKGIDAELEFGGREKD